jgi:hypothetical protein
VRRKAMRVHLITTSMVVLLSCGLYAQGYQIDRYSVNCGGGTVSSAAYTIKASVGQSVVGIAQSTVNRQYAGFWMPGYTISGVAELKDFVGDPTTVPVAMELRRNGVAIRSEALNLEAANNYAVYDVEADTYDVALKPSRWLRSVAVDVAVNDSNTGGIDVTLVNGDSNGDNSVGFADFNIVRAAWGADPESTNWDPRADLNGDDNVGFADFNILRKNWGLDGDE